MKKERVPKKRKQKYTSELGGKKEKSHEKGDNMRRERVSVHPLFVSHSTIPLFLYHRCAARQLSYEESGCKAQETCPDNLTLRRSYQRAGDCLWSEKDTKEEKSKASDALLTSTAPSLTTSSCTALSPPSCVSSLLGTTSLPMIIFLHLPPLQNTHMHTHTHTHRETLHCFDTFARPPLL
jgi:hypothetical protein